MFFILDLCLPFFSMREHISDQFAFLKIEISLTFRVVQQTRDAKLRLLKTHFSVHIILCLCCMVPTFHSQFLLHYCLSSSFSQKKKPLYDKLFPLKEGWYIFKLHKLHNRKLPHQTFRKQNIIILTLLSSRFNFSAM